MEKQIIQEFTKNRVVEMVNAFYEAEKARRGPETIRAERDALTFEMKRLTANSRTWPRRSRWAATSPRSSRS